MNTPLPPGACAPDPGAPAADRSAVEEREYDAFVGTQDPLDIEAATWVSRHHDGLDAAEEEAWRAWLAADPRHQAAFDDMHDTFGRLRDMPDEEVETLRTGPPEGGPPVVLSPTPTPVFLPLRGGRPASSGRRAWLLDMGRLFPQVATASVALSAVGGGWVGWAHWRSQPTFEKTYAVARGQQLRAELPDGSSMTLDTATQAEVRLYRDRREVRLLEGQALFSVQADPEQPFHVFAGGLRITVVGTRFSVRRTRSGLGAGETRVVVEEGHVRVVRSTASAAGGRDAMPVELTAGQSVTADGDGHLDTVVDVPPGSVAPWRDGRVNFDGTPLAQALAELERYGATGLVVRDPAVAALRVGGSFRVQNVEAFAESLPRQLPVRLERRGSVTEVVHIR